MLTLFSSVSLNEIQRPITGTSYVLARILPPAFLTATILFLASETTEEQKEIVKLIGQLE